jgi:hypothetical protein
LVARVGRVADGSHDRCIDPGLDRERSPPYLLVTKPPSTAGGAGRTTRES